MQLPFNVLRVSGGIIEDNHMLWANAVIVDDEVASLIEKDRFDVGQQNAKVKICTENNNELVERFAKSGLIPGTVTCTVKSSVKSGSITMTIVDFEA